VTEKLKYEKLYQKYGNPAADPKAFQKEFMVLWTVPMWIDTHIPALPNKIYINRDIIEPLETVLNRVISLQVYKEIHTWDGCYNIRFIRGSKTKMSIHSWGLAIDLNASHNPLGMTKQQATAKGLSPFTTLFDEIWADAGWTCGANFSRPDGMHFEYTAHLK
jgi:hypothetical protein